MKIILSNKREKLISKRSFTNKRKGKMVQYVRFFKSGNEEFIKTISPIELRRIGMIAENKISEAAIIGNIKSPTRVENSHYRTANSQYRLRG